MDGVARIDLGGEGEGGWVQKGLEENGESDTGFPGLGVSR